MHSCTFARESITTITLHIMCTVYPGLDIVVKKKSLLFPHDHIVHSEVPSFSFGYYVS